MVPTAGSLCPLFSLSVDSCPLCLPLSYLFLFCSHDVLPPTLYFFSFHAFSSASLPPSVLLCISSLHPPPPSFPAAHCPQAAEEAPSPTSCPESTCGSGSCFSPPSCARTLLSSRRLRQVGPGVQVWGPPGLPFPSSALPLHPWCQGLELFFSLWGPCREAVSTCLYAQREGCVRLGAQEGVSGGSALQHVVSSPALSCPGELNSRLSSDTKLMSHWLPLNANVLSRSLVKVLGLYSFMINLSPRLTLLSLLEVPLVIAAEKMYSVRHQVRVDGRESPRKKKILLEAFSSDRKSVV